MTLPVLHSLTSPELDHGQLPPDPCSCAVLMQAEIGTSVGGDMFNFTVATPDKLLGDSGTVTWGRGYLIVESFAWETAEAALRKLLMHADRPTWSESAAILAQELHWEFENYTPAPS